MGTVSSSGGRKPTWRAATALVALAIGLCFVGVAGRSWLIRGLDAKSRAHGAAAKAVRADAADAKNRFAGFLQQSAPSEASDVLLAKIVREFRGNPRARNDVVSQSVQSGDQLTVDLVLYGYGNAGGGGDYQTATVRMCVRLTGSRGPTGTAKIHDVDCPSGLPKTDPDGGGPVETVRL